VATVIPNEGKTAFISRLKDATASNYRAILYTNNHTPSITTTVSDLTEATFGDYAQLTPSWGSITVDGSNRATMTASALVWTADGTSGQNVYGWALLDISFSPDRVLIAEIFSPTPKAMSTNGDSISVTPTLTLTQA